MSQFREQSFHNSQFNSKESLLPKSDVERIKRKRNISEARANELRSDGSFSSDIPENRTQNNNEARKRRAVLANGVATKQLDQISDAHNRRLSREMRPAGVPTGSGPSHTAEVDALLRGGIPRDAWNSDSVVPGSMDDPKRSTASFESRRGKQIIAVTPDHRRLEDIAAPDFFVSEDDDDDDLFDEERTADGENSLDTGEDEYALLAKRYGITLPEDRPFDSEVDQEISLIAQSEPQENFQEDNVTLDFPAPVVHKQDVSESLNSRDVLVIGSSRQLREMAKRDFPVQKSKKKNSPQEIIPKREESSRLANIPVSEKGSSFQSGGRNVRLSMDHRRSHRAVTFLDEDIAIQGSQGSGFRQDTPNKGKETGRRRHLHGLEQQFERGGLLASSHVPQETKKVVGGSRRIVEFVREKKVETKPKDPTVEGDANEGYISADQRYELAVRKTPEILEQHNRKQKFLHKILDWDLNAIEERDFSYKIPFGELDFVDPSPKQSEATKKYGEFGNFLWKIENGSTSEKKVKVLHEMFLMLYDFYRLQGDIISGVSNELSEKSYHTIEFTDPGEEIIKKFGKYFSEYSDKFFADEIKEVLLLIQTVEKDIDRQKKYYSARHDIPRKQFFLEEANILVQELDELRNFFSKN